MYHKYRINYTLTLIITAGIRKDQHSLFDKHNTGHLDVRYNINNQWNIYSSYGTGFRAPNITELYFPNSGNTNLKPEKSKSTEVGIGYINNNSSFKLAIFKTKIKDQIAFDFSTFKSENIEKVKITGAEILYKKALNDWSFGFDYTYQKVRDGENKKLRQRPEHKLSFNINRNFSKGNIRLSSLSVSKQKSGDDFNIKNLPGYSVFNLSAKYKINRQLSLGFKIDNLLDKEYETVYGYNTPERSYYLNLEYTGSL